MPFSQEVIRLLRQEVEGCDIYPNSTKEVKVDGIVMFAEHAVSGELGRGDNAIFSQLYQEPLVAGLFGSAVDKALAAKRACPGNAVGAGADGTFWVFDGEVNRWIQLHQIGRDSQELSQEDIIREYRFLKRNFVYPSTPNGRVYLTWGHGLSYVNGEEQNLGDLLMVRAAPMELDYFQAIFSKAVGDGDIFTINARIPAFEAFSQAQLMELMGFMPHWAVRQRLSPRPFLARSNGGLEKIGKLEVITTMPWAILGYDVAQDYARNLLH